MRDEKQIKRLNTLKQQSGQSWASIAKLTKINQATLESWAFGYRRPPEWAVDYIEIQLSKVSAQKEH